MSSKQWNTFYRILWVVSLGLLVIFSFIIFSGANINYDVRADGNIEWEIQMIVPAVGSISHDLDSNGNPHITYIGQDSTRVRYVHWMDNVWNNYTIDVLEEAAYVSLDLDSANKPHISYTDTVNFNLKYAYQIDSDWFYETLSDSNPSLSSIKLNSENQPNIASAWSTSDPFSYYWGYVDYTAWNGTKWDVQEIESGDFLVGDTSLALDSKNNPHIAYSTLRPDFNDFNLKYSFLSDSVWNSYIVDSPNSLWHLSLALDSYDHPHIAYYGDNLKYAYHDGNSWIIEVVDGRSGVGYYTSLDLDENNNPHISYYDSINGDLLYAYRSAESWTKLTVESLGDVGKYTSLALDDDGNPHIAYLDSGNSELKYAIGTLSDPDPTYTPTPSSWMEYIPLSMKEHVSYFEGPWEIEPNDVWHQANGPLRSAKNYFGYPDERDYFSFYMNKSGSIDVDLTNHTGQEVQLQLFYQDTNNRLEYVTTPPFSINLTYQPRGLYFILIYSNSGHNQQHKYTLQVTYP